MNLANKILNYEFSFGSVGLKEKAMLAGNLSLMIRSGLTVSEALDIIAGQSPGKLKKILADVKKSIASGNSLADSFSAHDKIFSGFFISNIRSGESSGNLQENLAGLGRQLEAEIELMGKIRSAMIYPVLILFLSLIMGLGLTFLVLPKITPIFSSLNVDLPASTRMLIWISDLVEKNGQILFLALLGLGIFLLWFFKRSFMVPFNHFMLLKIPILGRIIRYNNLSKFARSLGTLIKSGISFDKSLEITGDDLGNYYFKKSLEKAAKRASLGSQLSDSLELEKKYFPMLAVSLIRVGEKSGNLEEELFNLAEIYEKKVETAARNLPVLIEPALLIVIGFIVGFLALSIITPIYKITGGVY